jgi:hypothetical protein
MVIQKQLKFVTLTLLDKSKRKVRVTIRVRMSVLDCVNTWV